MNKTLFWKHSLFFFLFVLSLFGGSFLLYNSPLLDGFVCTACGSFWGPALPFLAFCGLAGASAFLLGKNFALFYVFWQIAFFVPFIAFGVFDRDFAIFAVLAALFSGLVLWRLSFSRTLYVFSSFLLAFVYAAFTLLRSYESMVDASVGSEQSLALVETNIGEISGYLGRHPLLILPFVCAILLFAGSLWARAPLRRQQKDTFLTELSFLAAIFVFLGAFIGPVAGDMAILVSGVRNYDARAFSYRAQSEERRIATSRIGAKRERKAPAGPIVIVIGESANRNHWHLYGYGRPTTPKMESLSSEESIFFNNVVSCSSTTIFSLSRALTTASIENGKNYYDEGVVSLMEILRSAGVRVVWISNQAKHGLWGQTITDIASNADRIWFSMEDSRDDKKESLQDRPVFLRRPRDEALLPALEKEMEEAQTPTVIFVHLMGSHVPYEERYPPSFEAFSAAKEKLPPLANGIRWRDVDAYDNSILYTDDLLFRLIEKLKKGKGETGLLYFSDHGQSVFLGTGHDPAQPTAGHIEVPFVLWLSEAYRKKRPEIIEQAHRHAKTPFALDEAEQVILDLAGVKGPFYKPERSLLNKAFAPFRRMVLETGKEAEQLLSEPYDEIVRKKTGFDPKKYPKESRP